MNSKRINRIIEDIITKIIQYYQPHKIILFGSYAYGNPTPGSDIDLLIINEDSRVPIERRIEIRRIVSKENKEVALTLLVYTPQEINHRLSLGDDFVEEILTKGKILYAK